MNHKQLEFLKQRAQDGDPNAKVILRIVELEQNPSDLETLHQLLYFAEKNTTVCHVLVGQIHRFQLVDYYTKIVEILETQMDVSVSAIIDMAAILQKGWLGMSQDIERAKQLYHRAMEQCHSGLACQSLGLLYYDGVDLPPNYGTAMEYFKQGAKYKYADCEAALGNMYLNGEGVKQDYFMASYWYERAFEDGRTDLAQLLGNLNNPVNHILDDQDAALQWYHLGALHHNVECCIVAGSIHEENQDYTSALAYYKRAAELGSGLGCFYAGILLVEGLSGVRNPVLGRAYLEQAVALGCADATDYLMKLNQNQRNRRQSVHYNPGSENNVYLSRSTHTGMEAAERQYEEKKQRRREHERNLLRHAAAAKGMSGITTGSGVYMGNGEDSGEYMVVIGDSVLCSNGELLNYNDKTNTVYSYQTGKISVLSDLYGGNIHNWNDNSTLFSFGEDSDLNWSK